jgi:hypothetical protein
VATANDQFLLPPGQPEVAMFILTSEIPGIEPPKPIAAFNPQSAVLLRETVPHKHVRTSNSKHTHVARGTLAQVAPPCSSSSTTFIS